MKHLTQKKLWKMAQQMIDFSKTDLDTEPEFAGRDVRKQRAKELSE